MVLDTSEKETGLRLSEPLRMVSRRINTCEPTRCVSRPCDMGRTSYESMYICISIIVRHTYDGHNRGRGYGGRITRGRFA